jgi:hypothetical protein
VKIIQQGANILVKWNIADKDDANKAKQTFLCYTRQGWLATTRNSKNEFQRILSFSPDSGEVLFIPFSEGG